MRTERISSPVFESKTMKQRYITDSMRASIESILLRMNSAVKVEEQGDYYVSTIVKKLKSADGYVFEDDRHYKKPVHYLEQMKGFSVLKFGKTRLDIDNENGEITDYEKPFYKPWFLVLKKAEEVLYDFRVYFNDSDVVTRESIRLKELTPAGKKEMKKFVLQAEKQRLEEVIKKLEKEIQNENK